MKKYAYVYFRDKQIDLSDKLIPNEGICLENWKRTVNGFSGDKIMWRYRGVQKVTLAEVDPAFTHESKTLFGKKKTWIDAGWVALKQRQHIDIEGTRDFLFVTFNGE